MRKIRPLKAAKGRILPDSELRNGEWGVQIEAKARMNKKKQKITWSAKDGKNTQGLVPNFWGN